MRTYKVEIKLNEEQKAFYKLNISACRFVPPPETKTAIFFILKIIPYSLFFRVILTMILYYDTIENQRK